MTRVPVQPGPAGHPGALPNGARPRRGSSSGPVRLEGASRRRRTPYLLLGVLLVVGCATGGVVAAMQLGHREAVLELARPVSVGQQLTAADVREVSVSAESGVSVVHASAKGRTLGRPVAYSAPAGVLLTKDLIGAARVPPTGQGVAAVGLKEGQAPAGLQPGNHVAVVEAPSSDAATGSPSGTAASWNAVVLGVHADGTSQTTVVTLQLAEADARRVAAVPAGQLSVVVVHGGGR